MKALWLLMLVTLPLFAQEKVIISSSIYSIISGVKEYHYIQDRHFYKLGETETYQYHNRAFHTWNTLEAISMIGTGVTIGLDFVDNNHRWEIIASDVFLTGAIRNVLRDGVINLNLGRSFFHQSKTTHAQFEKYNTWYVKLSLLATAIIIRCLID